METWTAISLGLFSAAGVLAFLLVALVATLGKSPASGAMSRLLMVEGIVFSSNGLWFALEFDPVNDHGMRLGANAVIGLLAPAYLMLIRHAIPGRATAWLRTRAGVAAVWALVPTVVVISIIEGRYPEVSWLDQAVDVPIMATALYSFVVALMWRRRTVAGSEARRRATLYLGAFALQDAAFVTVTFGNVILPSFTGSIEEVPTGYVIRNIIAGTLLTAYLVALTAAVLRGQILDFDRKVRLTVSRTTAVAIVGAAILAATEILEAALGISDPIIAVPVAMAIFVAFRPIQKVAERFAQRVVPGKAIADMDEGEKQRLYDEQVELARADGLVTSAEEEMLARLRERLGIPS